MKLAIDCRMIGMSGIGTFLTNVAREISNHEDVELYVVGEKKKVDANGIRYVALKEWTAPIFSVKELVCFPVRFVNQCDVFFTPNYNIPMGVRIPVFSMIHDVVFFDVDGLVGTIGKWIRYAFMKRAMAISRGVFTVSEFSRGRILYHLGEKTSVVVVSTGVGKGLLDWRKRHTLPADSHDYYLFVGNIKRHKGLKTLLRAFDLVREREPESQLLIVGEKDHFRSRDNATASLLSEGSESRGIHFTGWVDDERLYDIIAHARALVQPSLYEGFGLPPLEAMYLGTPVIISDIPVFKEIYATSPARYFKAGNEKSLAKTMMGVNGQERICYENAEYDFCRVSDKILQTIDANT